MGVIKNYELPFVLDNIFVTEMGIFINVDGENCLISEKNVNIHNPDGSFRPLEEILSDLYSHLYGTESYLETCVDSELLERQIDDDELMKFLDSFTIKEGVVVL